MKFHMDSPIPLPFLFEEFIEEYNLLKLPPTPRQDA